MAARFLTRLVAPRVLAVVFACSVLVLVAQAFGEPWRLVERPAALGGAGELSALQEALEAYRRDRGQYPERLEDLDDGASTHFANDPWGRRYVYERPQGDHYLLRSLGANGIDEQGGGDDLTNRDRAYECETRGIGCVSRPEQVLRAGAALSGGLSFAGLLGHGITRLVRSVRPRR